MEWRADAVQNVRKMTDLGMCTGCRACDICPHILFFPNRLGFPAPVVDGGCANCGKCLATCVYDPDRDDE